MDNVSSNPAPVYKHTLHIYIPKEEWRNQYILGKKFNVVIDDDGKLSVLKGD